MKITRFLFAILFVAAILVFPATELPAVTGDDFVGNVPDRLSRSTDLESNVATLLVMTFMVLVLYGAYHLTASRHHKEVDNYLRRYHHYQSYVRSMGRKHGARPFRRLKPF